MWVLMVIMKVVILVAILLILTSLGFGLYHLFTNKGKSKKTVKSLLVRISLSLILFFTLFAAFYLGLIKPHAINEIVQQK